MNQIQADRNGLKFFENLFKSLIKRTPWIRARNHGSGSINLKFKVQKSNYRRIKRWDNFSVSREWFPVVKSFVVVCCQNWHWTKVNGCVSTGDRRKFTAARIPPSIGSIWWYTAMLIGSQLSALISIFHEFLIGVNGFDTNKIFKNRTFLKSKRLMLSNRLSIMR